MLLASPWRPLTAKTRTREQSRMKIFILVFIAAADLTYAHPHEGNTPLGTSPTGQPPSQPMANSASSASNRTTFPLPSSLSHFHCSHVYKITTASAFPGLSLALPGFPGFARLCPAFPGHISRYCPYLHSQSHPASCPSLLIPRTFGVLIDQSGRTYYHFMTYFPRPSLETHWIRLSHAQKKSVKELLEPIFQQLRKVPSPPLDKGRLTWGSGVPRRCIDTRRWDRVAKEEILDEKAFNDFLTTRDRGRGPWIKMVRSFMRKDRACAMTHADLHPRNIVVQLVRRSENGASADYLTQKDVKVLGVIDWDKSGWYPEYWEFVKALNTIVVDDPMQDWSQCLPHSIGLLAGGTFFG
ncbi:unnamed protein product [Chondrus crispus]|uniref:Aminoglycoside phosphotransferase domain-containing protein n=1 Tax=Chondrus crispus TaxID=2769 RepID=R7QHD7_CHOCR|nr:unnamed protein product [Chondrus crispus]CDF36840.1 unnamed protein product [Chondrus crispus]|eukprot:XP_005716659.1 unnamed protein product [Chondrus crispus]